MKTNGGTGGMEMNGLVDDPSPDWETCSSTAATDKLARYAARAGSEPMARDGA